MPYRHTQRGIWITVLCLLFAAFDAVVAWRSGEWLPAVVLIVLEGENAVAANREIMGATNPANAAPGTLRKDFATNVERNAVHGSDSAANAKAEIAYFFRETEIETYSWKG